MKCLCWHGRGSSAPVSDCFNTKEQVIFQYAIHSKRSCSYRRLPKWLRCLSMAPVQSADVHYAEVHQRIPCWPGGDSCGAAATDQYQWTDVPIGFLRRHLPTEPKRTYADQPRLRVGNGRWGYCRWGPRVLLRPRVASRVCRLQLDSA